jgi:hypothetical protein
MEVFDAQMQLAQMEDLDRAHKSDQSPIDAAPIPQSETLPTDLSFVQQAQKEQFWSSPWMRFLFVLLALILLALLAMQLMRTERERVIRIVPSAAPVVEKLCEIWPCKSLVRRQIGAWLIENSNFQKEGSSAFRLTATLKNTSSTTLWVPLVELQLLDAGDALLVRHAIAPNANDPTSLAGGAEKTFHWIITPQVSANASVKLQIKDMVGYKLTLFYP